MNKSLLPFIAVGCLACGGAPADAPSLQTQSDALHTFDLHAHARAALLAQDESLHRHLRAAGPVDGFSPFLSSDTTLVAPGVDLVTGRGAVRQALTSVFPHPEKVTLTLSSWTGDVSEDGLLGYTVGHGTQDTLNDDGTTLSQFVRTVAAWRYEEGGWRLDAFVWNVSGTAPTDPPPGFPLLSGENGSPHWGWEPQEAAEVRDADNAFAALSVSQGYTVAFTDNVAPNGVEVTGPMYWGAQAVIAAWTGFDPAEVLSWGSVRARSTFSGDLGWSVGNTHYTYAPGGVLSVETFGKYLTIYERQPDGHWKFLLDGGNSRPAPAK